MLIHIVKQGDTAESISKEYGIPQDWLIEQNGITNPYDLVIGQTIAIVYPQITYIIQDGDTLISIAKKYQVDIMQILRNNPFLSERNLIPGETIIISFDTTKERVIATGGFAYPYIAREVLQKTLPFLTYLTVFNYQITKDGDIIDIDDTNVIELAKSYRVAPMMFVSFINQNGTGDRETSSIVFSDEQIQDKLINNLVDMLKKKGYYGLNQYFQYLSPQNQTVVINYINKLSKRLHREGFRLVVSVTPRLRVERLESYIEPIDYQKLYENVDEILYISYEWGESYEPPGSTSSVSIQRQILDYTTKQMPPEKIIFGVPIIGYDWELPYIKGKTVANALTTTAAIELALVRNVDIQYSNIPEAPYFFYNTETGDLHIVWFKDARSIDAITNLIKEYNLFGLSIWNIMQFFSQLWLIINCKYEIDRVI